MEISARWHTLEMSGIKLWINGRALLEAIDEIGILRSNSNERKI